ncbi:FAD-dependent oxidoreductase [Lentibacillus juripiscarius]|uniref:FAD-dependent oxidoreductase n=1 Tax=Lentibacillus juripiscarius TaxID=257446 RepID=A0ABW5V7L4_9BACI
MKNVIDESAVIVGASLSGLMTGIALARAGLHVTILEKAGEDRRSGGGLQVDDGVFNRTKTAKFLKKLVLGGSGGMKSIQFWSSIESRLRSEAQDDSRIDLRYDTRVQTIHQDDDAAWVVTDKGETICGDILIGADGHRSVVRRHVAPHKPDATFAGYLVWLAAIHEKDLPKNVRPGNNVPSVRMLNGLNGLFIGSIIEGKDGSFNSVNRRIGCTWYDNTQNDLLRRLGCVEGTVVQHSLHGPDIPEKTLNELAEQVSVPEPWLSAALQAVETRNLTGIPIKEYVPDNLVNGRMALVGDAGHVPAPITASGFNESLQDAAVLGEYVAKGKQGSAAVQALNKYESLRLKKVRQMVQSGQWYSQAFGGM